MTTHSPMLPEALAGRYSDLSPEQIRALVARGQYIRSHFIATTLRSWYREWRAVFRRPARILPTGVKVHSMAR